MGCIRVMFIGGGEYIRPSFSLSIHPCYSYSEGPKKGVCVCVCVCVCVTMFAYISSLPCFIHALTGLRPPHSNLSQLAKRHIV